MVGDVRRDVAREVVELLREPRYKQGREYLSRGLGADRVWCGAAMFAEVAIGHRIIPPAVYVPSRNAWAYAGQFQSLPREVCEWALISPVGPELTVERISPQPVSMMYLSDTGATFTELADALSALTERVDA